jgi:glycosyltransferase involved in cell wall biosynthesis
VAWVLGARAKQIPIFYHEIVSPPGADSLAAWNARRATGVIANSTAVAERFQALLPEANVVVLPFLTVDADPAPPSLRPAAGERVLKVAYFGRLISHKRPDRLVEEWARLMATPPIGPARLDLYGFDPTGETRQRIAAAIESRGLQDRVALHGEYRRAELPDLLLDKDLVVLPSEWEGLPLILVEAMQHGVPFVATSAGGTAELGRDNPDVEVTGTEWDSFVAGLGRLCQRVRRGDVDARRVHEWATRRYGYEVVSRKWQELLANPGGKIAWANQTCQREANDPC